MLLAAVTQWWQCLLKGETLRYLRGPLTLLTVVSGEARLTHTLPADRVAALRDLSALACVHAPWAPVTRFTR